HLPARLVAIGSHHEIAPVEEWSEGRRIARQKLEPVTLQAQFPNDLGSQQARDVGSGRDLEAWPQLFGHARAAHELAALEDKHPSARTSKIGGGDQAVVASPDDDDIIADGHDAIPSARCSIRPSNVATLSNAARRSNVRELSVSLPWPCRGASA